MTNPSNKPPVRRRDGSGHIDPTYAKELLERSGKGGEDGGKAFVEGHHTTEELGEELGEAFLESATSGEEAEPERRDRVTAAEEGGPFVETTEADEVASGRDASNPTGATREPFPRTRKEPDR